MRLTTKGRLALVAMVDLGLRQHRGPVALAGIAMRQAISLSYLEQLFARLRRHQLVQSTRGPGGGYRLAKPVESISVADIICAVDKPAMVTGEWQDGASGDGGRLSTQQLWSDLNRQMTDFLSSVSLGDLIDRHSARRSSINGTDGAIHSAARALSDVQ
jgi:Rrf2 family iron-sulfur cluster assembly transcriptional regulator